MCRILGVRRVSGMCLRGVWEVSGGCLSESGYCPGRYDVQAIDNHAIRFIYITVFLFLPVASDWSKLPYFGVSVGCLEGVWEVSGGCLAHAGSCLGPIDAKSIARSPVGMIN